jgi:hypothetical protein
MFGKTLDAHAEPDAHCLREWTRDVALAEGIDGLMDSAILSLLGAFMLSIIGLFAFVWSRR